MRTKKDFTLCEVCGETILLAEGEPNIDFSEIISLNETSAFLWNAVEGKEFDAEMLANLLCQEYEVSYETALNDVNKLISFWKNSNLLEQ